MMMIYSKGRKIGIVYALVASLHLRSALAFAPVISYTSPLGEQKLSELSMVSQKEKRRLQDGAKRREAYEELQVAQAQAALVVQLQELQGLVSYEL